MGHHRNEMVATIGQLSGRHLYVPLLWRSTILTLIKARPISKYKRRVRSRGASASSQSKPIEPLKPLHYSQMNSLKAAFVVALVAAFAAATPITDSPPTASGIPCMEYIIACPCGEILVHGPPPCYNGKCIPVMT